MRPHFLFVASSLSMAGLGCGGEPQSGTATTATASGPAATGTTAGSTTDEVTPSPTASSETPASTKTVEPTHTGESLGSRTETVSGRSLELIHLSAGSFQMGSPSNESGRDVGEVPHSVRLTRSVSISKTEVTQALYQALMGTNPSEHQGCEDCPAGQYQDQTPYTLAASGVTLSIVWAAILHRNGVLAPEGILEFENGYVRSKRGSLKELYRTLSPQAKG